MKKIWVVLLGVLLAGCASFYATKSDNNVNYPPTDPAAVKILKEAPSQPYIVIGQVGGEGEAISVKENMEKRLKEDAAAMGGEAIILTVKDVPYRVRNDGTVVEDTYAFNLNQIVTKKMTGKVIRFKK